MSLSANNPSFALVANPGSRRVELFQRALAALGAPPAQVIAYKDICDQPGLLTQSLQPGMIVKIDSPGKDFAVEKQLLKLGVAASAHDAFAWATDQMIDALPFRKGEILFPNQGFCGFEQLLGQLAEELQHASSHVLMNDIPSIASMFDKPQSHQILKAAGVPVPRALATPDAPIRSHADLLARMATARMPRVFVKLAYGSSGSGVIALQTQGTRQMATTTVEMVSDGGVLRLFNSRRIRTYADSTEIRILVDALCTHRVHVEEWIPKAGIDGKTFDLRVVVVAGQPRFFVVRTSRTPITNLHLLNTRGDVEAVRSRMGTGRWSEMLESCRRAAALFPGCLYVALDVAIRADWRAHYVLELNAFGDLLPGVLDAGEDIFTAQIVACARTGVCS